MSQWPDALPRRCRHSVEHFFLTLYPDGLQFTSVLNGNMPEPDGWQAALFQHEGCDTALTFGYAMRWRTDGQGSWVRRSNETIE